LFRFDTVDGLTRVPHNASVMSSTRRTDTPLHRALPPPIALDDRRLERLLPQLGHPQRHLARLRLQFAAIALRSRVPPRLGPFITAGVAPSIRDAVSLRS
jgi:hypothetical protein